MVRVKSGRVLVQGEVWNTGDGSCAGCLGSRASCSGAYPAGAAIQTCGQSGMHQISPSGCFYLIIAATG
eukprot:1159470-Pelagomonas_calceolata.AAC.7